MSIHTLTAGKKAPEVVNVIVEIPRGSHNKYEFDHESGLLKLDRVLFSAMHYPADYGYVPQTLGDDGDPLDALVLVTNPTYPGTLIEARPLGMLEMVDGGDNDEKLICVPVADVRFAGYKTLKDVPEAVLNEIAHFFKVYKDLENKKVEILGWKGKEEAQAIITKYIGQAKK